MHRKELVARLTREFGFGDNAMIRLRCYGRLAGLAEKSETVLAVVRAVALEAKGKKNPGRWFCSSVSKRLQDCGLLSGGDDVLRLAGLGTFGEEAHYERKVV